MRLILVRHAEAAGAPSGDPAADSARPLTDLGRLQAAHLAESLRRLGVAPDLVLTSPLTRTAETAEALAGLLPDGQAVMLEDLLKPEALRPKKLTKLAAGLGVKTVVLVGHAPDVGVYAAWLLGAEEDAVPFEKGAAACLVVKGGDDVGKGCGVLEWFVNPAWCEPPAAATFP